MIDWIAAAFELSGDWLVGDKKKIGFILKLVSCTCWIVAALSYEMYGLLLVVVPALFINTRNFIKWIEK